MTDQPAPPPPEASSQRPVPPGGFRFDRRTAFALLGTAAIAGMLWLTLGRLTPLAAGVGSKAATERIVHDYIIAHPEVLIQSVEAMNQPVGPSADAMAALWPTIKTPPPGAVAGNPDGKIVLVEFSDFACGYCRKSVPDIERLIATEPDLKVVYRDLPVLSPQSLDAAKMALAAGRQGKYHAYYLAQFEAGRPTAQSIRAAAQKAGLDMARAQQDLADPALEKVLEQNVDLARKLGFTGTPSFVIDGKPLVAARGYDAMKQLVDAARK